MQNLQACFRLRQVKYKIYCSDLDYKSSVKTILWPRNEIRELLPHSHIFAAFYPTALCKCSRIFLFFNILQDDSAAAQAA